MKIMHNLNEIRSFNNDIRLKEKYITHNFSALLTELGLNYRSLLYDDY